MKLPESWLRQWINYDLSTAQLSEQLSISGLETIIIPSKISTLHNIVVGQIIEVSSHPNADRLHVCIVNCGRHGKAKTIICGASNVRQHLKVAVALPGAQLSNKVKIITRKIRSIQSEGMLCSLDELGLDFLNTKNFTGIWEVPQAFTVGLEIADALPINDAVLDVQVPPNRGDCLSVLGLSREIAVLTQQKTPRLENAANISANSNEVWPVTVTAEKACPRYMGCMIRGLNTNCSTPLWIVNRLYQSGMRSIHPIVDVTNYILLEFGQPLHAFDLGQLSQSLNIRFAKPGETLTLLNNMTITLNQKHLVVADQIGPQALAGIMGGLHSSVTDKTVDIFLESAFFQPQVLRGIGRQHGIMSESSYRFERGVDPQLCKPALEKAIELLLSISGGQASAIQIFESSQFLPKTQEIVLRYARLVQILGIHITPEKVESFLTQLSLSIVSSSCTTKSITAMEWRVQVPSWRFDLQEEIDLIEEMTRCYGYEHIPETLPTFLVNFQPLKKNLDVKRLRSFWVDQGYYETVHYSFTDAKKQQLLNPNIPMVVLANPISQAMNVLRTNLWPNLLSTLSYHQNRQNHEVAIFEIGTVFTDHPNRPIEQKVIGGLVSGHVLKEQWGTKERLVDFFDLKQLIHNSLQLLDPQAVYTYVPKTHPALNAGNSSRLIKDVEPIGWIGALDASLYEFFDVSAPIYLFEYQLPAASARKKMTAFKAISRFPYIRRDLAFWISGNVPFNQVESIICKTGGPYLIDSTLFDVYVSKDNPKQRSLGIGLIWQHPTRTLTDYEVDRWQTEIASALQQEMQVALREQ